MNQLEIINQTYRLAELILHSSLVENYTKTREQMYADAEALASIASFQELKEKYEEVQRFGKYHPDYRTVLGQVREAKKKMDSIPVIVAFKKAEDELDEVLYQVSRMIADAVSSKIKVLSNNPLQASGTGCGSGGCGSGGCGCHA